MRGSFTSPAAGRRAHGVELAVGKVRNEAQLLDPLPGARDVLRLVDVFHHEHRLAIAGASA